LGVQLLAQGPVVLLLGELAGLLAVEKLAGSLGQAGSGIMPFAPPLQIEDNG